jgi:hypothetical protein
MKTLTLSLAALAVLWMASSASADGVYGYPSASVGVYGGLAPSVYTVGYPVYPGYRHYHPGWYRGWGYVNPPVVVRPVPVLPRVVYPPVYPYYYGPSTSFRYYGPGVGVSIGF